MVCWSARVAITEYHRLSGSHGRNVFSHTSGGWKSKVRVLQVWFLQTLLLGLKLATFLLCPHMPIICALGMSLLRRTAMLLA